MTIRAWYNRRDFFGGLEWDQEAAREFSTEAEAIKTAKVYKNAIALKLTKTVLKYSDGCTDVEQVYATGE